MGLAPLPALALTVDPVTIDLAGDPGETVETVVRVVNDQDTAQNLEVTFGNFAARDESGLPTFVTTDDVTGISSWMQAGTPRFSVKPRQTQVVRVSIAIPKETRPGGYYGAIFVQPATEVASPEKTSAKSAKGKVTKGKVAPPAPTTTGASIATRSRIAALVLLQVKGEVTTQYEVKDFQVLDGGVFSHLPVNFSYRVWNGGAAYTRPSGDIRVSHIFGLFSREVDANPGRGAVLSGTTRKFTAPFGGAVTSTSSAAVRASTKEPPAGFFPQAAYEWKNFAFGRYTAELVLRGELSYTGPSAVFWVIPYHLLSVGLLILALIASIFLGIRYTVKRRLLRR